MHAPERGDPDARPAAPARAVPAAAPATPAGRLSLYWDMLRLRWRLAAAIVAVAVLAGVGAGLLAAPAYDATARVLIGQRAQVDALLGTLDYSPDREREINTSLELVGLEPVADEARRRLGLRADVPAGTLSARVDSNSNVVSLTARDASPQRAAQIANAYAGAFRDVLARSSQSSIEDAVAAAKRRAAELPPGSDRTALEAQIRRLEAAAAFRTGGVQVVGPATAASAAATRNLARGAVLAGLLGLVLAAIAIIVLARTDRRARTADEIEAAAGLPVLAHAPHAMRDDAPTRDAFAGLALSLTLRNLRSGPSRKEQFPLVLLLTSPGPGEGTSGMVLGLTRALGELGLCAMAIEADLRAPRFAADLGLQTTSGLNGVLADTRKLEGELVQIPLPVDGGAPAVALAAGAPSVLPQPLLVGKRMTRVVAEARDRADVVLIAGPPAGRFADSLALARLADAVLLVAHLEKSRREELGRVVRHFEEVGARPAGVIVTSDASTRPSRSRYGTVRPRSRLGPLGPAELPRPKTNSTAAGGAATNGSTPNGSTPNGSATNGAATPSTSPSEVTTR